MYRSILVPLDGSTFAEHALPHALAIARRSGATIKLVTVSTPLSEAYVEGLYFSSGELEQEITARHHRYLHEVAVRLRERDELTVNVEVKHGEVATCLTKLIEEGQADLVVMATHGRGAMGRFWLGSVADEMIRHAQVPLLLVRPLAGTPDLHREPPLDKILLALDGSEHAEQILRHATRLAKLNPNASILLLRAIQAALPDYATPESPEVQREALSLVQRVEEMQTKLRQTAEAYLNNIAVKLRELGLNVETDVVVEDQPAKAILEDAESRHMAIIALETHGRSGLSRMLRGSVTEKVLRASHIPVLVHCPTMV